MRHLIEVSQADLKAPGSPCLWLRVLNQNARQSFRAEVEADATDDRYPPNPMQALNLKAKVAASSH